MQRHWLGHPGTEEGSEDSRAARFVIVVVAREVEPRLSLHVDGQVSDVVEERRDDQGLSRAGVAGQRGALQGVLGLGDRLTVGLLTERFAEVEELVDGRGLTHFIDRRRSRRRHRERGWV